MRGLFARLVAVAATAIVLLTGPGASATDVVRHELDLTAWDGRGDPLAEPARAGEDIEAALARLGGSRRLLQFDVGFVRRSVLGLLRDEVRSHLRDLRIGYVGLAIREGAIEVRLRQIADVDRALERLARLSPPPVAPEDRVDVRHLGDGTIRVAPDEAMVEDLLRAHMQATIEDIERRLRELGSSGRVDQIGRDRILVLAPGVTDPSRWTNIMPRRAKLHLGLIQPREDANSASTDSNGPLRWFDGTPAPFGIEPVHRFGAPVVDATAVLDPTSRKPMVAFRVRMPLVDRFAEITGENQGRTLAFLLSGMMVTRATIHEPVLNGRAKLTGPLTAEQAREIATLLRAGVFPGPVSVVEESVIKPGAK
jgi:preprotein translocase subunit SecD